jgi:hypothetical protein
MRMLTAGTLLSSAPHYLAARGLRTYKRALLIFRDLERLKGSPSRVGSR